MGIFDPRGAAVDAAMDYATESTANLAANGTFNGQTWDMGPVPTAYRTFVGHFVSAQASATNGAKIQVSDNGSAWSDAVVATLAANVPQVLTCPVIARYMRVSYTNGATLQTSNRIGSARTHN